MLKTRRLIASAIIVVMTALTPVVASAHPVGTPGEPNCFGNRVSHGSSDHGLTPKERAAGLQFIVYESGFVSPEERAAFEAEFGVKNQTVTVQIFARFVRKNCSDDPFIP